MTKHNQYSERQVAAAIQESVSWAQVLEKLGLQVAGGNYKTVQRIAEKERISTSHFKGAGWSKGQLQKPIEDFLKLGVKIKTGALKAKLFLAGLKENKCEKCGLGRVWQNEPIIMELDHIDGNQLNNRIENLRILCPNCHSQTPTFRGRKLNKNKVRVYNEKRQRYEWRSVTSG